MSTPEKPAADERPGTRRCPFSEDEVPPVASPAVGRRAATTSSRRRSTSSRSELEPFERLVAAQPAALAGARAHRGRSRCSSWPTSRSRSTSCTRRPASSGRDLQEALEQLARHPPRRRLRHRPARGGRRLAVPHRPRQSAEYVRRFLRVKPQRLTRAALETLAIIAYRQPVTRPEIEDIRGRGLRRGGEGAARAQADRRSSARRRRSGRPILYGTTREFLEFFALKDLSALPTLREFHELSEEHRRSSRRRRRPARGARGDWCEELADPGASSSGLEESAAGRRGRAGGAGGGHGGPPRHASEGRRPGEPPPGSRAGAADPARVTGRRVRA